MTKEEKSIKRALAFANSGKSLDPRDKTDRTALLLGIWICLPSAVIIAALAWDVIKQFFV